MHGASLVGERDLVLFPRPRLLEQPFDRLVNPAQLAYVGKYGQAQQACRLTVGLDDIAFIVFYDDARIHLVHDQLVVFFPLDRLGFRLEKHACDAVQGFVDEFVVGRMPLGGVFKTVIVVVDGVE